jgi:hypothetical protein
MSDRPVRLVSADADGSYTDIVIEPVGRTVTLRQPRPGHRPAPEAWMVVTVPWDCVRDLARRLGEMEARAAGGGSRG